MCSRHLAKWYNHPTRAVFRWAAITPDAIVRYGGHAVWRSPLAAIAFFITTLIVADIFGFHISSRQEAASVFASKIRGHWNIENQLHWVKDVLFEEDSSLIRQSQPACNISILKTIGINLLRSLGFLSITEGQRWLGNRFWRLSVLLE